MSIFNDWFSLLTNPDPAPGTNVDPTHYLRLWAGQRGENEHVKCIGIRGEVAPDHVPMLGIYEDVLILMIGNVCMEWKGSTNPGLYFINHPTNPKGCAQLIEGIHMFKAGIHNDQFPAFVQAEDFPVNRLNEKGQVISRETGQFGIHLHSGGPGEDVNQYSAGSQIVWSPEGYFGATWHRFFDLAQKAMQDNNQSVLPYMLLDAADLPSIELSVASSTSDTVLESVRDKETMAKQRFVNTWFENDNEIPPFYVGRHYLFNLNIGPRSVDGDEHSAAFIEPDWAEKDTQGLLISLFSEDFKIKKRHLALLLPREGQTDTIKTQLTPLRMGQCRIEIIVSLSKELEVLQTVFVEIEVKSPEANLAEVD